MKPLGPVQLNNAPVVDDVPLIVTAGVKQVNFAELNADTPAGGALLSVTVAVADLAQPFAGLVMVIWYWPGVFTDGLATCDVKPVGPLQLYVTPGVDE